MSKTTTILLILGVALFVGIGVYFKITPQMILETISHPETLIPKITTFLGDTWQYILTGGLSVIGAIIMFADKIRAWQQTMNATKEQASQTIAAQEAAFETKIGELQGKYDTLEDKFNAQATTFTEQSKLLTEVQRKNEELTTHIKRVEQQRNDATRDLKALEKDAQEWHDHYIKTRV